MKTIIQLGLVIWFSIYTAQGVSVRVASEVVSTPVVSIPTVTQISSTETDKTPQKSPVKACKIDFNTKVHIVPPQWFKDEIRGYSCKDQQVLSRLAFLESTYNRNAVNPRNKYAKGLYQILGSSWKECERNGKAHSDHECALYHYKVNHGRFEAYTRNKYLFKGL